MDNNYTIERCVRYINKNKKANFVVRLNEDDSVEIIYDVAHKGKKPTIEDCEEVWSSVKAILEVEQEKADQKKLVDDKIKENWRAAAIADLIADGTLPADYTE